MSWALGDLVQATGADLVRWGAGPFLSVGTDSRKTREGEVFVALAGPHHDGHGFVGAALARGATAIVVSRDVVAAAGTAAWLRVGDGFRALGDLAAARRRELATRVVGVTGSNGKTTTKEMIASVLAAAGAKVAKSAGTENNLVGLPQTILRLDGDEAFAVLEMGMNHAGEIWRLAEIANPDVGVITNVGPAHLEGLGSIENVAAAKAELALALAPSATLVVNGADPRLATIADRFRGRTIRTGDDGPVRALEIRANGAGQRLVLAIEDRKVSAYLHCLGEHNVANALLAAATGHAVGLDAEVIAAGLEAFEPPPMRLQAVMLRGGIRVLNDAYNANPASVAAAVGALAALTAGRRIAVLGEMLELGDAAPRLHREAAREAATRQLDRLLVVGPHAADMLAGALEGGLDAGQVRAFGSTAEVGPVLAEELRTGDVVLVKGSRGARMEEIVLDLERRLGAAAH